MSEIECMWFDELEMTQRQIDMAVLHLKSNLNYQTFSSIPTTPKPLEIPTLVFADSALWMFKNARG